MARETWIQSQVESYQRLKKWYLMPPCLILSIIRYGSRVKWSNPGKGVAPSPTPWCSSYRKGSLRVTLEYRRQLYFYLLIYYYIYKHIYIYIYDVKPDGFRSQLEASTGSSHTEELRYNESLSVHDNIHADVLDQFDFQFSPFCRILFNYLLLHKHKHIHMHNTCIHTYIHRYTHMHIYIYIYIYIYIFIIQRVSARAIPPSAANQG